MPVSLPDLNKPDDLDIDWTEAAPEFWYKLYHEHHYWTLWVDAVKDTETYYYSSSKNAAADEFSSYVIEVGFYANRMEAGVCLRNFSWTPMGGWCLFRNSSSKIDTYRYGVYEFRHYIDELEISNQGDYEDKGSAKGLKVSTSKLEYINYFGCEESDDNEDLYLCKIY